MTWKEQQVASFDMATAPKVDRPVPSLYLGGASFVPLFPMAGKDPANRTDIFTDRVQPKAGL